jgi:putative ABC transport system ATP-binding protein
MADAGSREATTEDEQSVLATDSVRVERGESVVLESITLSIPAGSRTLVRGPSGAGKTTLFRVLGLLEAPTAGELYVDGEATSGLGERARARIRRDTVGIVFQDFQLVPDLTARENVALPQEHTSGNRDPAWLDELFERLAIARALANRSSVVLADEPTGQVDPETAERVLSLLFDLQAATGTALVVVSHDRSLGEAFPRTLLLENGRVIEA